MNQNIYQLVLKTVADLNPEWDSKVPLDLGPEAPLFGDKGGLDSLQLVSLVVAVEQAIQDHYKVSVALADEKALSQTRSPFKTVGTLTAYAEALLPASVR